MPLSDVGFYDSQTLQKLLGAGGQVLQHKSAYDAASPEERAAIAQKANAARTAAIQQGIDPAVLNELFGSGVTQAQANKNFQYLSDMATRALAQETQAKSTALAAGPTPSVTPGGTPSITPGTAGTGGVTAGPLSNVTPTPGGGVSFKVTATGNPPPAGTPTRTFEWNGSQFVPVAPPPSGGTGGGTSTGTGGGGTSGATTGQGTGTFTPTPLGNLPPPPGVPTDYMKALFNMMDNAQSTANIGNLVVPPVDLNALRTEAQGQVKLETDPQLLALQHQQENLNRVFDQKIAELEPKFDLYTKAVSKAAERQRLGAKESMNARGMYFSSLLEDVIGQINESELASIGAAAADKTALIKNMAEDLAAASQQLGQQKAQIESSVGLKENLIFAQLKREAEAAARQGALDQFNARARAAELNMQSIGQNMTNLMTLITNQQNTYQKQLDRELQTTQAQLDRDLEIWKTKETLNENDKQRLWNQIEYEKNRIADINAASAKVASDAAAATTAFGRQKELAGIDFENAKILETIRSGNRITEAQAKPGETPLDFYLRIQTARDSLLKAIADPAVDPTTKKQIQAQITEYETLMNQMRPNVMGPGGVNVPGPGTTNNTTQGTATTGATVPETVTWVNQKRTQGVDENSIYEALKQQGYRPEDYGVYRR